ncbi:NHL repeat containing protein, partial [Candidatus Magnetomorum sp. HK-1]
GGLSTSTSFNLTVTEVDESLYMWANQQAAEVVLGQSDFTSSISGTTSSLTSQPYGVAVDPTTGKVFISDVLNDRILRFSSIDASVNGSSAEAVFGQADFTSGLINRGGSVAANTLYGPRHISIDMFGRLWVADTSNNRVLRFDNAASKSNGANADFVLGQPDFLTNTTNTTQSSMYSPRGAWLDPEGRLWVADKGNNRVLRFDDVDSKTNGANADGVLGQTNFTNNTNDTTQSTMYQPFFITGDNNGTIFVAEYLNHRVLRFDNAALKANGANADGVLGQSNFTSNSSAASITGMDHPAYVHLCNQGRLYVADHYNSRVMIFNDAINKSNGADPDYVLGQPDSTSNTVNNGGISERTMNYPLATFFNSNTNYLWVTDVYNHRVLRYSLMLK